MAWKWCPNNPWQKSAHLHPNLSAHLPPSSHIQLWKWFAIKGIFCWYCTGTLNTAPSAGARSPFSSSTKLLTKSWPLLRRFSNSSWFLNTSQRTLRGKKTKATCTYYLTWSGVAIWVPSNCLDVHSSSPICPMHWWLQAANIARNCFSKALSLASSLSLLTLLRCSHEHTMPKFQIMNDCHVCVAWTALVSPFCCRKVHRFQRYRGCASQLITGKYTCQNPLIGAFHTPTSNGFQHSGKWKKNKWVWPLRLCGMVPLAYHPDFVGLVAACPCDATENTQPRRVLIIAGAPPINTTWDKKSHEMVHIWKCPWTGLYQSWWFTMENPTKNDLGLGASPFRKHP